MKVLIRPAAQKDVDEAYKYYEKKRKGLGVDFARAFRRAIPAIRAFPEAWQSLDRQHRRFLLTRFPYGIVYRYDVAVKEVVIVAVMHLHRHPDSWRRRR